MLSTLTKLYSAFFGFLYSYKTLYISMVITELFTNRKMHYSQSVQKRNVFYRVMRCGPCKRFPCKEPNLFGTEMRSIQEQKCMQRVRRAFAFSEMPAAMKAGDTYRYSGCSVCDLCGWTPTEEGVPKAMQWNGIMGDRGLPLWLVPS